MTYLKQNKEANKVYLDKIHKGSDMGTAGIAMSVIFPFVAGIGIWVYFAFDAFSNVIDSAKEDLEEAKEISSAKRKKREYDEYKEEIV